MDTHIPDANIGGKSPDNSENYDKVESLKGRRDAHNQQNNEVESDGTSQPYNFKLEQIDSFMMQDSEDGLGITINSSKFGKIEKKDPIRFV